ncbi:MAG: hypothetical protein GX256_02095 [Fretibacterium sp.]|nr:hypothetical protein [Fretibacterium sp.]
MRRFFVLFAFFAGLTAVVLLGLGLGASEALASAKPQEILEVTGTLERVETGPEGDVIVLVVSGKEASGPLHPECLFLGEDGAPMPRGDFLSRYLKRYVTLELGAEDGLVRICRVNG